MNMYVIDDYSDGTYMIFHTIEGARIYMIRYYLDHFETWYREYDPSRLFNEIKDDFQNLNADYPYIEDVMYLHEAVVYES